MFKEILYKTNKLVFKKDEQSNYIIETKDDIKDIEDAVEIAANVFSAFFGNNFKTHNNNTIISFSDELDCYSINLISRNEILIDEL